MNKNLCKAVLSAGGELIPLIISPQDSKGLGLMNPSILIDKTKILLNLRNINYTLYHCEGQQLFNNRFGPLAYLHPENDMHLRTFNFLCELDPNNLTIKNYSPIDTSAFDKPPVWDFVGLEDIRLVRWDEKLFGCGVRRDTKPNGEGRMELSELIIKNSDEVAPGESPVKEINRYRIEPPTDKNSYCEKNWMPVLDMPYHFVKWVNPTEVVKVFPTTKSSQTVFLAKSHIPNLPDFRGGSQVINWKNYRICLIHEVNLFKNKLDQKDGQYRHRFVIWDKNWNIVKLSKAFSFLDGEIEFTCGMALYKNDLLISFGFQDNAAFVLKMPEKFFESFIDFNTFSINETLIKKKKWESSVWPSLEITTTVRAKGCVVDCVFCPQRVLVNAYEGERIMSLENFKLAIDKVPKEIVIIFSGFCEPWLNKNCTDMVLYAHETGHRIAIFTTGIGMTIEDFDKIKHIPFSLGPEDPKLSYKGEPMFNGGFTLHLPDNENYAKHPITEKYIELLEHIKNSYSEVSSIRVACMGTVHDKIKHIFSGANEIDMWSRANNVNKEVELKPELKALENKGLWKSAYRGEALTTCALDEKLYHNVLMPNGDITLCCMDYNLDHILGNLYTQEYDNILPDLDTPFNLCRFCENGINL